MWGEGVGCRGPRGKGRCLRERIFSRSGLCVDSHAQLNRYVLRTAILSLIVLLV